jgi:hypothetical protein
MDQKPYRSVAIPIKLEEVVATAQGAQMTASDSLAGVLQRARR